MRHLSTANRQRRPAATTGQGRGVDSDHLARARGLGIGAALATGCAALLAARATGTAWTQLSPDGQVGLATQVPVDGVVELLAWAGASAALSWLTAVLLLAVRRVAAQAPRGGRRTVATAGDRDGAAPLVGRVAAVLLTLTVAAGPASAASGAGSPAPVATSTTLAAASSPHASPAPAPAPATEPSHEQPDVPTPGWTPTDRPRPVSTDDVSLLSRGGEPASTVVVQRGDTLWDIAARHLGGDPSADRVAAEWPRWYAANLDVIGPDPDLILPGQQLVPPPVEAGTR